MQPAYPTKNRFTIWRCFVGSIIATIGAGCSPESTAHDSGSEKHTILFVCAGNIQRSVVAEMLLRKMINARGLEKTYEVMSSRGLSGTPATPTVPLHNNLKFYNESNGRNEWEHSLPTLQELGIAEDLQEHRSTTVSRNDLERADLVIAMDNDIMSHPDRGLLSQFPMYRDKTILFTELVGSHSGISDAAGTEDNGKHRRTILMINRILHDGLNVLISRFEE